MTASKKYSGVALISDIALHHIETLYGKGTTTLAGLSDLIEVCQTCVLSEVVLTSPNAFKHSALLQQCDFAATFKVSLTEGDTNADPPVEDSGSEKETHLIDLDDSGNLFGTSPPTELFLSMFYGEIMQDDPMLGRLFNPTQLPPEEDRGVYYLRKLPGLMIIMETYFKTLPVESEDVFQILLDKFSPTIQGYENYAGRLLQLQSQYGIKFVNSILEDPLLDSLRLSLGCKNIEENSLFEDATQKIAQKLSEPPDRRKYMEPWRIPALGLMVIARASSLDDIPKEIQKARDVFHKLRKSIWKYEERLIEASQAGEEGWRDIDAIKQELVAAYAAFDETVAEGRKSSKLKRIERRFNLFKYFDWFWSLSTFGLGITHAVTEHLNLRGQAHLGLVHGLSKAASFVRESDSLLLGEMIERFLGKKPDQVSSQKMMLTIAIE